MLLFFCFLGADVLFQHKIAGLMYAGYTSLFCCLFGSKVFLRLNASVLLLSRGRCPFYAACAMHMQGSRRIMPGLEPNTNRSPTLKCPLLPPLYTVPADQYSTFGPTMCGNTNWNSGIACVILAVMIIGSIVHISSETTEKVRIPAGNALAIH
jgi:hypothetical protein